MEQAIFEVVRHHVGGVDGAAMRRVAGHHHATSDVSLFRMSVLRSGVCSIGFLNIAEG